MDTTSPDVTGPGVGEHADDAGVADGVVTGHVSTDADDPDTLLAELVAADPARAPDTADRLADDLERRLDGAS